MIVACMALFVALGGTSFAAVKLSKNSVGTREIKKNGVAASEVKNNSLTGSDINESKLGQVPSAGRADSAATADSAGAINGQKLVKIRFVVPINTAETTIMSHAGLTITGSCSGGGNISLTAKSATQDSSIYADVTTDAAPQSPVQNDKESGAFDAGDTFDLLVGTGGNVSRTEFHWEAPDGNQATGWITADASSGCSGTGHAIVG